MRKLEQLTRDIGPFDIVEFVDWAGPGFFTIQQKRLGRSFTNTDLVVRLHGTETVLRQFETRPWAYENLTMADIERQALAEADYCISHLLENAKVYQSIYDLPEAWLERCAIELPPVTVSELADEIITPKPDTNLCFSSKFQGVKRPGLFLAGVSEFMAATPGYRGSAVFAAFVSDQQQVDRITRSTPAELHDRITLATSANDQVRHQVIQSSVVIFPNVFETFCFAAYEASLAGAIVVLNEKNSAFGPGTPWIAGINCLKFDGTAGGLATLLARIFDPSEWRTLGARLAPIAYHHQERPYWLRADRRAAPPRAVAPRTPGPLSIVLPNRNGPDALLMQLQDLDDAKDRPLDIIIVDRGSDDAGLLRILDRLDMPSEASSTATTIRVIRRTKASNYAAMVNAGIAATRHDVVAVLPNRQRDTSAFINTAANAIAAGGGDVVLPTLRIHNHYDDLDISRFWIPLGGALGTNLFVNRLGFGAFVARRELLRQHQFDESLPGEWSWDLLLRLAYARHTVLVDIDRGISVTDHDLRHWSGANEPQRQVLIEAVRRNSWRIKGRFDFPWVSLGDGELTTAEWFINPQSQAELQSARGHIAWLESERRRILDQIPESFSSSDSYIANLRAERQAALDAYHALANARTVRLALKLGNALKRIFGPR
jgi:hypothetical protein